MDKNLNLFLFCSRHSNFDQDDLFHHLEMAQKKRKILEPQGLDRNTTVADILNTWTKQSGYPVVHFRKVGLTVRLKQVSILYYA